MRPLDVLFLYEHADRELDVACAVKTLASQRYGLRVEISQHPHGSLQSDLLLGDLSPRLVILPHAYMSSIYTPYLLDWPDAIYINAMWEQIFYPGNEIYKLPTGPFSVNHVLHHVWGNFSADYLRRVGVPTANIVVNGNLAYGLYDPPYCQYYLQRADLAAKYNLDLDARWVFFPENYAWGFYSDKKLQDAIGNGQKREDVYQMRDYCRASFDKVIHWCGQLAQHVSMQVIVRPRPFTPYHEFEQVVLNYLGTIPASLKIIKDETVREWAMASDSLVSSYSTSLIEGAVAGKPVHMLEPFPLPKPLYMNWHDYVPRFKSYAEFECFELDRHESDDQRLAEWARSEMMSRGDPLSNFVELLADLLGGRRQSPPTVARKDIPRPIGGAPMAGGQIEFHYHRARRKYQHWRVKMTNRMADHDSSYEKDLLPQNEIRNRTEKWGRVLNAK